MIELLKLAKEKKGLVLIGDYVIEYNGIKQDTITGKTESWTVTRKNLPIFTEESDK